MLLSNWKEKKNKEKVKDRRQSGKISKNTKCILPETLQALETMYEKLYSLSTPLVLY